MNERTFAVVANILSAMPSQQPWDDRTSTVYALAMKKWDDELTQKAVMKCLMTKRWRPTPSEIREVALGMKRVFVPGPTAYQQVKHIVLHYPANERKAATEKLVQQGKISAGVPVAVANLGGWSRVGSMPEDHLAEAVDNAITKIADDPNLDVVLESPMTAIGSTHKMKMIGE
jgi:hypothetical protein